MSLSKRSMTPAPSFNPEYRFLFEKRESWLDQFTITPERIVYLPSNRQGHEVKLPAAGVFELTAYVKLSRWHLEAVFESGFPDPKGWFKIEDVLPVAAFQLHLSAWRTRFRDFKEQDENHERLLNEIIQICKTANDMIYKELLDRLAQARYKPSQHDLIEKLLFTCLLISKTNMSTKISYHGVLERSGIFLYSSENKHRVMALKEQQTGEYSQDFRCITYSHQLHKAGWLIEDNWTTENVKVKNNRYPSVEEVRADVVLLYQNTVDFNGIDHIITSTALEIRDTILNALNDIEEGKGSAILRASTRVIGV